MSCQSTAVWQLRIFKQHRQRHGERFQRFNSVIRYSCFNYSMAIWLICHGKIDRSSLYSKEYSKTYGLRRMVIKCYLKHFKPTLLIVLVYFQNEILRLSANRYHLVFSVSQKSSSLNGFPSFPNFSLSLSLSLLLPLPLSHISKHLLPLSFSSL